MDSSHLPYAGIDVPNCEDFNTKKEESKMEINVISVDLAKNVFQVGERGDWIRISPPPSEVIRPPSKRPISSRRPWG